MDVEKRKYMELLLAFYMGALNEDLEFLESISLMSNEELDKAVSMIGELYDWE